MGPALSQGRRRLAALLSADVAGYSRLMERDDAGTMVAVEEVRERAAEAAERNHGRLIDAVGDNLLATFDSVVSAVTGALELHDALERLNSGRAAEDQLLLRIGVHVGEVLEKDDRLYGEAVNVAARLEGLAAPGGICVSDVVEAEVREKVDIAWRAGGNQALKNIARAIDVFHARGLGRQQPARGVDPYSGRPVVAVFDFANRTGEELREKDCLTLTEDLAATLSQFSSLGVVLRHRSSDPAADARDLGADFALTGSLREAAGSLSLRVQLATARPERVVWSDQLAIDETGSSLETAAAITARCAPVLSTAFAAVAGSGSHGHAWQTVIEAESQLLFRPVDPTRHDRIVALCHRALESAPDLPLAWSLSAAARISAFALGYGEESELALADEESARALELAPADPVCMYFRAVFFGYSGDPASAVRILRRALDVYPGYAEARAQISYHLSRLGNHDEALAHMERAKALSPRDPRVYLWRFWEAMIHVGRQDWERAEAVCRESIDAHKRNVPAWLTYISALVARGRSEAAADAAAELKSLEPGLDEARLRRILGMGVNTNPRFVDGVLGIYRSVGLV